MHRLLSRNNSRVNCVLAKVCVIALLTFSGVAIAADPAEAIQPRRQLAAKEAKDQDDVCFWLHPTDHAQSLIIASDKSANLVFVYDLDGGLRQQITVSKPGNIDIRQRVKLDGKLSDVVVVNQRSDGFKLRVFRVDTQSRLLVALDDGNVLTGPNYGGCLYHSRLTEMLYFICTSETGHIEQHALTGNGQGGVVGKLVRSWKIGKCEGAVADDESATLLIAEETKGIWKFRAEPDAPTDGELIAEVGVRDNLSGDLEGMAIYRPSKEQAVLLVSDQGQSRFVAFDLKPPHQRIGEFQILGAKDSDGIDLLSLPLGPDFPEGIFACHTDVGPRSVQLSSLADIRRQLRFVAPVSGDK